MAARDRPGTEWTEVLLSSIPVAQPMAWLKDKAPGLHRFLSRHDRPYPVVREVLGVALGLLALLLVLFLATGQPFKGGYPVVVVTSGSMMHCDNGHPDLGKDCDPSRVGGLGYIDPGDLVFVRRVHERDDVTTLAQDERSSYGLAGDIIVYRPNGLTSGTPIIHRALFYLQVNGDGTYTIEELGLQRVSTLDDPRIKDLTNCALPTTLPGHGVQLRAENSGFITRGDNNAAADQCQPLGLGVGPIKVGEQGWVLGKARGELPWIGLIKLFVDDVTQGTQNFSNANGGAKGFLVVTVVVLVAGPWVVERIRRRGQPSEDEDGKGEG